ncbi:MAG: hypothetical protein L6262_02600 [Weeksellaceae bacterium]|nr:hypothetical protein [Weeksellaceae bacterium]
MKLKNVTKDLYTLADEAKAKLLFLIDYADGAGLDTSAISGIRKKFTRRNIEGAIKDLRELLPYLENHKAELEAGDMPKNFLDYVPTILPTMKTLNAEQIAIISTRKYLVEDNQALFNDAYGYISKTITRGKKVFKKNRQKR